MNSMLTKKALTAIMNNEVIRNPVLQILGTKLMSSSNQTNVCNPERYRVVLSDGELSVSSAMLGTQLNDLVKSGVIDSNCVVRIGNYAVNQMTPGAVSDKKKVIVVYELEVLKSGSDIGSPIGNPQSMRALADNQKPAILTNNNIGLNHDTNPPPAKKQTTENYIPNNDHSFIPSPGTPAKIAEIVSISPFMNRWTIKARVIKRDAVRAWNNSKGEGKLFSCILSDGSGQIKATAFRNEVDRFYDILEQGKCFCISKGQIKTADKKFSTLEHPYEIIFTADTTITPFDGDTSTLPSLSFAFIKLAKLIDVEPNAIVDVIGVVNEVSDISTITAKASGKELRKRELTIVDDTETSVKLTLWGENADQEFSEKPIVALKGAKLSDFGGRSLSCQFSSILSTNPDISDCHRLRGWYLSHKNIEFKQFQGERSFSAGHGDIKSLDFLKSIGNQPLDKPIYFDCIAAIQQVKPDSAIYKACPKENCNKKLGDNGQGRFRCEKCQEDTTEFKYRLMLQVLISDRSYGIWITAFQDQAEVILGHNSQELGTLFEEDSTTYGEIFSAVTFKYYNFRLRSNVETYQDESKLKTICQTASLVDAKAISDILLKDMKTRLNSLVEI